MLCYIYRVKVQNILETVYVSRVGRALNTELCVHVFICRPQTVHTMSSNFLKRKDAPAILKQGSTSIRTLQIKHGNKTTDIGCPP